MNERSRVVQDIVDLRYPSDDQEDRHAAIRLKLVLTRIKTIAELLKEKGKMEADPEYMPTY